MSSVALIIALIILVIGIAIIMVGVALGFFTSQGFKWYDWFMIIVGVAFLVLAIILVIVHYTVVCQRKKTASVSPTRQAPPVPRRSTATEPPPMRPIGPYAEQALQNPLRGRGF